MEGGKASLLRSIEKHTQILDLLNEIQRDLDLGKPEVTIGFHRRLETLLEEAREIDLAFSALTGEDPVDLKHPLVAERMRLLREIERKNGLLSPKLEAMMAVLSAALKDLNNSRKALTGYRTKSDGRGGTINNAC